MRFKAETIMVSGSDKYTPTANFIGEIRPLIEKALVLKGHSENDVQFFDTAEEGMDSACISIYPDSDNPTRAIRIAEWIRITETTNGLTTTYFQPGRRGELTEYKTEAFDSMTEAVVAAMAEMLKVELTEML